MSRTVNRQKMMKKIICVFTLIVSLLVIMSINASAYLDPSAMTYLIQIVAAIVISCGAVITIYRKKITLFIKKQIKKRKK